FSLQGADQTSVNDWAAKIVAELSSLKQLRNVSADVQSEGLTAFIDVDRDTAARLGITPETVDETLYDAFGHGILSTIFTQSNQYRVILEADPALAQSMQGLQNIYMQSPGGSPIPLSAFATVRQQLGPLQVNHISQFPAANISFDTAPGVSLG